MQKSLDLSVMKNEQAIILSPFLPQVEIFTFEGLGVLTNCNNGTKWCAEYSLKIFDKYSKENKQNRPYKSGFREICILNSENNQICI